jgi:triosephosphate isomerase
VTKYVLANWKSHKTVEEGKKWLAEFLKVYQPDPQVEVILAPSYIHLVPLYHMLQDMKSPSLCLAVQDLSPFPLGAYNGAVAAAMVRDMAEYAIIGHSERRRYFHETDQEIANKASEAAAAGIKPILCVDQPYARAQMTAMNEADMGNMIIGYGPVEAIGVNIPQSLEKTRREVAEIQEIFPEKPILYGGSINAENAASYMQLPGVSGLMVGSASLDPEEFAGICQIVSQS